MMQITEDTPPDMLAGAMDLIVQLPTGRTVKMAVERSTPMMDLLVQITTNHHLQLSNYTLQALGMAQSSEHTDKILPYKPNTPIGTLDTQHIKVVPKTRTIPVPKNVPPGQQPFESTFRLKVHLPRNQLYVTRVSRNVLLEDIMKKMCEEKNLDPLKYEFKHPGNIDRTLDPKLTLSDYQITEIYAVSKGSQGLSPAFSSSDIMALRKEEERKQMHNKTGGGVFNLIFRRGKSSMGSGSVSSDTRSISPTHSDDSRSVTPPAIVQQPILSPPKQDPPPDRPKPPQRKRRPAPKPPQTQPKAAEEGLDSRRDSEEKPSSTISEVSELQTKKPEVGLVICHSRNSSDSSGYHEASVLSENCNASLPRRPKSAFIGSGDAERLSKMHSQSTTNLSKMASHSKSTTSLGITGRKKKTAPPPPPAVRASNPSINLEPASPVVASQSTTLHEAALDTLVAPNLPKPFPRSKTKAPPVPHPRNSIISIQTVDEEDIQEKPSKLSKVPKIDNDNVIEEVIKEVIFHQTEQDNDKQKPAEDINTSGMKSEEVSAANEENNTLINKVIDEIKPVEDIKKVPVENIKESNVVDTSKTENKSDNIEKSISAYSKLVQLQKASHDIVFSSPTFKIKTEVADKELMRDIKNEEVEEVDKTIDTAKSEPKEYHTGIPSKFKKTEVEKEESIREIKKVVSEINLSKDTVNTEAKEHDRNVPSTFKMKTEVAEELVREIKTENVSETDLNTDTVKSENKEHTREYKKHKDGSLRKLPPEIVAVIPKTPHEKKLQNKYDSFGKRKIQRLHSMTGSFDEDTSPMNSGSVSRNTSVSSALATFNFVDEFLDLDDKVFSGSVSSKKDFSLRDDMFGELYGMHDLEDRKIRNNRSISSLRSLRSLPGFYNTNQGLKKWNNYEELDDVSLASHGPNYRWVIGDSEPESLSSHQALDSLASITSCASNTLADAKDDIKPFGSTDSGIAAETNEKLSEIEDFRPITPPPPPIFSDLPAELEDRLKVEPEEKQAGEEQRPPSPLVVAEEERPPSPLVVAEEERPPSPLVVAEEERPPSPLVVAEEERPPSPPVVAEEEIKENNTTIEVQRLIDEPDKEVIEEIDWQYQLPSPPKAFRDASPLRNENTSSESVTDFKDSVVTSPELFEKLKSIEDAQSVSTFVGEEPPLNTLSLENLEKRKSLVYNRELSTSLKMNEEDAYTNSLQKFESTFVEVQKSSQKEIRVQKTTNTLPNFKISTYDRPKQKIKVFEDDTVRSNTDYINKSKENRVEQHPYLSNLNRSYVTGSMENIAARKMNFNSNQQEEKDYVFYKPDKPNVNFSPAASVFRSESFSMENTWSTAKPVVSRSKSFLTLNGNAKYRTERKLSGEENMERSNSLYDVSGLQSLGVMRLIQNKLNTPTTSLENLHIPEEPASKSEPLKEAPPIEVVQKTTTTEKIYKYRGPPAINMGTWSERPKVPVSVKEDDDYKLGNAVSSKLIVNTTNDDLTCSNSIEIKNTKEVGSQNDSGFSIKVNGADSPENKAVIQIGNPPPKTIDNHKFFSHTTAVGYRKPFTDINKNPRPYSIAFDSEYDISRVPVVRSVELKKPYRDFGNTSVTQITQEPPTENKQQNGFLDDKKPGLRPRMFNTNGAPVVRGFKPLPKDGFETNSHVPFSQVTLRRTKSSILDEKETGVKQPPPPPTMPKIVLRKSTVNKPVEPVLDSREQLLSAIRNFGGKKGLKSGKV